MVTARASVLVVDDEREICELLFDDLSGEGYLCSTAFTGQDALTKLKSGGFNVVLLDIKLPDISGMEILSTIHSSRRNTAAIIITGIDSVALATEAMKCGAADYFVKPFSLDEVNKSIQKVLENKSILRSRGEQRITNSPVGHADGESPVEESHKEMDAIASGVQARHDLILGHSKIITQETAEIARQLGLPEGIIQSWVKARSRLDSEKRRAIRCSLDKLERSPMAQELMGLMRPYPYMPKNDEAEN